MSAGAEATERVRALWAAIEEIIGNAYHTVAVRGR